jgi:glycosyltransferase involved in cell wall biosynthesis
MNIMPIISIIIPAFNAEATIAKTIQSVLDQTFSEFEIIVIDDGSSDSTVDIVYQFNEPRLRVLSFVNAGLPASRNRGIKNSNSKYIAFLDADDLWTQDKLAEQFKALENRPQAALAYSWTDYIDENDNFLFSGNYISPQGDVYKEILLKNFLENGSNPLIRRDAIEKIGLFDESLTSAEDWEFWVRLASQYEFVCVSVPQILYRQSLRSMSANLTNLEKEALKVIDRNFLQAPKELQNLKHKSISILYLNLVFKGKIGIYSYRKNLMFLFFCSNQLYMIPHS